MRPALTLGGSARDAALLIHTNASADDVAPRGSTVPYGPHPSVGRHAIVASPTTHSSRGSRAVVTAGIHAYVSRQLPPSAMRPRNGWFAGSPRGLGFRALASYCGSRHPYVLPY